MKVGTFFSGVGSPEQALSNLGIEHEIEFACDIDKYAKQTYLKNFKPKLFAEDITTLDMKDLPYVDLLVFGFPCQAFSIAGKRKGFDDTRGTLFYDALRYLKEHRPRYFIAENVRGLLSHDKGKTFGTIIDCLAKTTNYQMSLMPFENLGYHIHYKVLNTKNFGIPQNRERIFIIGIRDDEDNNFNFPKEIPLELKLKDILQDNPNSKYYLSDKMIKYISKSGTKNFYYKPEFADKEGIAKPLTSVHDKRAGTTNYLKVDEKYYLSDEQIEHLEKHKEQQLAKGNGFHYTTNDGTKNAFTLTTREGHRATSNWISHSLYPRSRGADDLVVSKAIKKTQYGKRQQDCYYDVEGIMGSILVGSNGSGPHMTKTKLSNNRIRRLTPIECERLQGFPDNFTAGVSDTQRYKQMGNTITVNVIQAIIKKLIG